MYAPVNFQKFEIVSINSEDGQSRRNVEFIQKCIYLTLDGGLMNMKYCTLETEPNAQRCAPNILAICKENVVLVHSYRLLTQICKVFTVTVAPF